VDGLECQGLENHKVLVRFCCRQALLLTEAEVELVITNDEWMWVLLNYMGGFWCF